MLSVRHDAKPSKSRLPTKSSDPAAALLQAALDDDVGADQLRILNDAYEGRTSALASIPGMGRN